MEKNGESKHSSVNIFKDGSNTPSSSACTKAWIKLINESERDK